jgi:hypothetical protein
MEDHLLSFDFEGRLPYFKSARLKKGFQVCKRAWSWRPCVGWWPLRPLPPDPPSPLSLPSLPTCRLDQGQVCPRRGVH